jgi:hypothetical protein
MRRAAVFATEARVTLFDTGFMPFQAPPRAQPLETMGRSPGGSETDQRQLSGRHARRLRALTQAAHLLAWKLQTKRGVRRDDRRSREAITDGRGLLLRLSFLVRGGPRYVSGLRRVREPQPRFRRGREADGCRTGSTAHPRCRCTRASSGACWAQATLSMSSPTSAEPALLAVAPWRQIEVRAMNAIARRAPSSVAAASSASSAQRKKRRQSRGPLPPHLAIAPVGNPSARTRWRDAPTWPASGGRYSCEAMPEQVTVPPAPKGLRDRPQSHSPFALSLDEADRPLVG